MEGLIASTWSLHEAVAAADLVIESAPVMDMVEPDVVRDIEMVYYRESGDASDAPPQLLLVLSASPVGYALETRSPYNPGQPPAIYRP